MVVFCYFIILGANFKLTSHNALLLVNFLRAALFMANNLTCGALLANNYILVSFLANQQYCGDVATLSVKITLIVKLFT